MRHSFHPGESAIDGGGPRREFFMLLLLDSIQKNNSLLNGPLRVLMIALSVIHGGPG